MPERLDTLSLISIQHELAMNIGLNPELRPMVRRFMEVCLRRLSLRRVHFFIRFNADDAVPKGSGKGPDNTWCLSMPTGGNDSEELNRKIHAQVTAYLCEAALRSETAFLPQENLHLHLFPLPGMGVVVMERLNIPLQDDLTNALIPIFERMGTGCQAALQHERIILEISRRKEVEKHIEHLAYHDDMTGLPNRRKLLVRIKELLAETKDTSRCGGLLYLDLDNFRDINDSLGHFFGDFVLVEIANRLCRPQFKQYFPSRLAGDSFVLLTPTMPRVPDVRRRIVQIASLLQAIIAEPIKLGERTISVSASIGIVELPNAGDSADTLLGQGSLAMFQAKMLGRNTLHFYEASMAQALEQRLALDTEMRTALDEEQFELYLQPQVDGNATIIGAEALIRWKHPEKGLVSPGEFILQAEKSGFIVPLSDWVLRRACHYIKELDSNGMLSGGNYIAVNLSAKYFHQADFTERVLTIIEELDVNPEFIELELTESTLLDNVDNAINKIYNLKARGIRFSIDDFGTGYSSLAYVKRLPVDRIKIDRSFVRNIDSSPDDAAIVEAIISMAAYFNLDVIAEGVENKVECSFLKALGCGAFQGFLFHRPMEFQHYQDLLQTAA